MSGKHIDTHSGAYHILNYLNGMSDARLAIRLAASGAYLMYFGGMVVVVPDGIDLRR